MYDYEHHSSEPKYYCKKVFIGIDHTTADSKHTCKRPIKQRLMDVGLDYQYSEPTHCLVQKAYQDSKKVLLHLELRTPWLETDRMTNI